MNFLSQIIAASSLAASSASAAPVQAVNTLDLNRYLGTWYEVATIPQVFQLGCTCTTANYSLRDDGNINVNNSCRLGFPGGFPISVQGQARLADRDQPGQLKVRFFGAFEADYWVLNLAEDYSYALVGSPDRKTLWVLSRDRTLPSETYDMLLGVAKEQGFDLEKLRLTRQNECSGE